jgi:hypothetical protein
MPIVQLKPDTLNDENAGFEQAALAQPVFLNSVPKSGSHLLRNIIRMFVPVAQQYDRQFIQYANLQEHLAAFDPAKNYLSWGHLFFSDASAIETAPARKILLVRDPYSWVLARGRFFVSEQFSGNADALKDAGLGVNDLLSLMIFGIHGKAPPMRDIYDFNAAAWLGSAVTLLRYEELVQHLKTKDKASAKAYFGSILDACGIAMPADWAERVRIGSDPAQSGTARENLHSANTAMQFPAELPAMHKAMVDYAVPGLRNLLGYA